ncbi:MAG TPA: GDSL-type esterase/lipase family protein [Puia sp.]|nr:GDSL-type esterase/lipase family protein [Puia sp.]
MRIPKYHRFIIIVLLPLLTWDCQKHSASSDAALKFVPGPGSLAAHVKTGVCIGNSIISGLPWRESGLQMGVLDYPDSFGQISYHLSLLTGFKWWNRGWGGQTTAQIKQRFLRDAIGDSSDPGDGRGAVTLFEKPDFVVLEGGVNDIYFGIDVDTIEANLGWMASMCKQNHIHCIVLNSVSLGNGMFSQLQVSKVFALNNWLAAGALDSVQATVIDINSIWNSGAYKGVSPYSNDNVHFSTLVNPADGIHFTRAGYDSVANVIYRYGGLSPL